MKTNNKHKIGDVLKRKSPDKGYIKFFKILKINQFEEYNCLVILDNSFINEYRNLVISDLEFYHNIGNNIKLIELLYA